MTFINQKINNHAMTIGIIGICVLFFLFSFLSAPAVLQLLGLTKINASLLWFSRGLCWLILAILWLYTRKVEKQKLLLWEEKPYDFLQYLLSIITILITMLLLLIAIGIFIKLTGLNKSSAKMIELLAIFKKNKLLVLFTALTAGIVEEFIFRGYMQPRLDIIFKNPYVAILLSSLLFGLLHIGYGTLVNVIGPFLIGLIFACYYWKFRNIKVLIICHFLWDFVLIYLQSLK